MHPIIDTHHHLWDLSVFRVPWTDDLDALHRSFVMRDYLDATQNVAIAKTIYMEVDVDPAQQVDEANYVIELCEANDNPMAAAVISGRPASREFKQYISAFRDSPYIKGVRQVLHVAPPGTCIQATFIEGVQLLGEMGLSFDICALPGELANAVKLVDACPGTRFVLDHCGNARVPAFGVNQDDPTLVEEVNQWRRDIDALALRENVICKISGIVAGAGDDWTAADLTPVIMHCLDSFGPDRVVFGGDWPVCTLAATYEQWVAALTQIVTIRSDEDQRKLFHDNAFAFYGLG